MKRIVDIFIEGNTSGDYERLELFDDEKIIVNSSIQNVQDISKVFTDFSQSFTIPASTNNNRLMHYFYESDLDIETDVNGVPLWNPNYKRNAFIEIDTIPFRSGKIALEKANVVNNRIESYTIGFYGDLITLKDLFANDKLSDLDYSGFDIPYSYANVRDVIKGTSAYTNVKFPLISSKRLWSYGNATTTDISITGGAINYTELFPALSISSILSAIENKYLINFTGNFTQDNRFKNTYLWFKNTENFVPTTYAYPFEISVHTLYDSSSGITTTFTTDTDYVTMSGTGNDSVLLYNNPNYPNNESRLQILLETTTVATAKIDIYINGNYQRSQTINTNVWTDLVKAANKNIMHGEYSFRVSPSVGLTGQIKVLANQPSFLSGSPMVYRLWGVNNYTWTAKTSLDNYVPDMTIENFFTSILKTFNLTCYATSSNSFRIEPLDDFFSRGAVVDITDKVITDNIEVKKAPIYKSVRFEHAKSENFLNVQYADFNKNTREYGDAKITYEGYDSGDFNIVTGFSDMLQTEIATNLQVGYSLGKDPSYEAQTPAPLLLYKDTTITGVSFKLTDGTTTETITQYVPMGAETTVNNTKYSLHFSQEQSVITDDQLFNSLYETYYSSWLNNLYNPKCRLTTVQTILPVSLLTGIKLQDRVIIRDKRYTINDIKMDITSGECTLSLLNDFRPIINGTYAVTISGDGGTTTMDIIVPDGATVDITSPTTGVIAFPTTFTDDGTCEITYPPNPNPTTYINTESSDRVVTNDFINVITEASDRVYIYIIYTITYSNGTTEQQTILLGYAD